MLKKRFFKTKDEVEVTFELPQGDYKAAAIAGDFNEWQAEPMKVNKRSKAFTFKTRLAKNKEFEYKYLLDDSEWQNDPAADAYVANEHGGDNCVVKTVEEALVD